MSTRPHDILDQMAVEARRLYVSVPLPPPGQAIPFPTLQKLSSAFERFLQMHKLTGKMVARRLGKGFSEATISHFRNFYKLRAIEDAAELDWDMVPRKIARWMEEFHDQQTAVRPADYVETHTARLILESIQTAIRHQTMASVVSDSGRGKTLIAKAAADTFTGVYMSVIESHTGKSGFLRQLAKATNVAVARRLSAPDLHMRIIDLLEGSGRPIFIDEGHKLQRDALECLRDVWDHTHCPIIVFGTRDLDAKIDDRDFFFGQLSRRFALRLDLNEWARDGGDRQVRPLFTIEEVRRIFESEKSSGVRLADDAIVMLYRLANVEGEGGMGLATQFYIIAAAWARAKKKEVTAAVLQKILTELRGKRRVSRHIEQGMKNVPDPARRRRTA